MQVSLFLKKAAGIMMARNVQIVRVMRDSFSRDEDIDAEKREKLIALGFFNKKSNSSITADEDALVERVREMLELNTNLNMKHLKSPDPQVKMELGFVKGDRHGSLRAEAIIDADIQQCMAYDWDFMSRKVLDVHVQSGGMERNDDAESDHCAITRIVINLGIYGMSMREFVNRKVWKQIDDDGNAFVIAYAPVIGDDNSDAVNKKFPLNSKHIRAHAFTLFKFERCERSDGNKTKVTFFQRPDLAGIIPLQTVNYLASIPLMLLSTMRKCFDRSEEINKFENDKVVKEMKLLSNNEVDNEYEYDAEETALLEEGEEELKKSANYDDVALLNGMSNLASLSTDKHEKWIMVTTEVRGSAEQVLAHLWHFEGREMRTSTDVKREVVVVDDYLSEQEARQFRRRHHRRYQIVKLVSMSDERHHSERDCVDFLNTMVWKKNENGSYLLVSYPRKNDKRFSGNNATLGKLVKKGNVRSYFHIEATAADKCVLKHAFCLDLGEDKANRKLAKKMRGEQEYLLPLATKVQEHFQRLRCNFVAAIDDGTRSSVREMIIPLGDADGIAMGEALMIMMKRGKAGGKKKKKAVVTAVVKQFVSEYKAMSILSKEFTWIESMLGEIFLKVRSGKKIDKVESKLECLEEDEARCIGSALIAIAAKSINENVGVNAWIEKYPSMKELCERHKFIALMMEVIATQTVREVNWMMLLEAAASTAVSFFDLITDLYMIYFYFTNDQSGFAIATIGMILMSILMQCFAVFLSYQGDNKAMKRELFYVMTLTKGGRIQLQVLKGENTQGCVVPASLEMMFFEVQEV
jgi:hypothetical protein